MFVPENDMVMNIVADRLNAAPSRWHLPEKLPRRFGQAIGFAISAPKQEEQRFLGQVLHGKLLRLRNDHIGGSRIVHDASAEIRIQPFGATMRVHQLPKLSR